MVRPQKQISFVQVEKAFLYQVGCGDGARVICLFAGVMQQLGVWTQNIQANVDYCCVWPCEETRRVHFARPRTQASEPALTDPTLGAKRRANALHVAFFSTKHPSPARCCFLLAAYFRMRGSHERRALGELLFLVLYA